MIKKKLGLASVRSLYDGKIRHIKHLNVDEIRLKNECLHEFISSL